MEQSLIKVTLKKCDMSSENYHPCKSKNKLQSFDLLLNKDLSELPPHGPQEGEYRNKKSIKHLVELLPEDNEGDF